MVSRARAAYVSSVGRLQVAEQTLVAIVDDDESVRDTTRDLLRSAGFSAEPFPTAESLLASPLLPSTACLVTDMCMPGMSGLELHERLVASNRRIPTIVMTAYPDELARARALESKVVAYLIKPFSADELLACIRTAIGEAPGEGSAQ
jgi:FixJ family two-component response regulator